MTVIFIPYLSLLFSPFFIVLLPFSFLFVFLHLFYSFSFILFAFYISYYFTLFYIYIIVFIFNTFSLLLDKNYLMLFIT